MEVSVFDQSLEKIANVDMVAFYNVVEKFGEAGKFSLWVEANEENMQILRKRNIVQFKFDDLSGVTERDYVPNGALSYGVTKSGSELNSYYNENAYMFSSDAEYRLNNKLVVASLEFTASQPIEVGVGGHVKVTIPYTSDDGQNQIELDVTELVKTQSAGSVYMSTKLPLRGLRLSNAIVSIQDINGTVSVKNLRLQVGQTPSPSKAYELDMELKLNDVCWGIITTKNYKDDGSFFGIEASGFLIEDVLRKRILWGVYYKYDNYLSIFRDMVTKNMISPTMPERKLTNIGIENQPVVDNKNIRFQKTGGHLLDAALSLLTPLGVGIKGIFDPYKKQIRFYLYKGKDRSDAQSKNPVVMFSYENGMLVSPKYLTDDSNYKNVVYIAGEGEGVDRIFHTIGDSSGWSREELYVDARDIQSQKENGTTFSPTEYIELLNQRGLEKLDDYAVVENFESGVQTVGGYVYGKDYSLGDIVTVYYSEIGVIGRLPILEVTRSGSADGESTIISFGKSNMPFSKMVKTKLN